MANILQIASGAIYAGLEALFLHSTTGLSRFTEHKVQTILFHDKILADRLREQNIPVEIIPVGFLNYRSAVSKIRKFVIENKIDIVHSHGYKANIAASAATKGIDNLKRVRTEHGLSEPFHGLKLAKYKYYDYLDRKTARANCDRVLAVSADVKNYLESFLPSEKVLLVPNCVPPAIEITEEQKGTLRDKFGLGKEDKVLASVGRLNPVKNVRLFIDLIGQLAKNNAEVKGLIVGDGPLRDELEEYAGNTGFADKIIFAGFRSDIAVVLSISTLLIFSSLHEGLPIILLEAMSQGTPVSGVGVGGVKDVLGEYCPEVLSESHDIDELTRVVDSILNDPEKLEKLARQGKEIVERKYSIKSYAGRLDSIYNELLESK